MQKRKTNKEKPKRKSIKITETEVEECGYASEEFENCDHTNWYLSGEPVKYYFGKERDLTGVRCFLSRHRNCKKRDFVLDPGIVIFILFHH